MEFIKKEYKPLLIIFVLFLINVFLFKYKMIPLYIDFGKEICFSKAVAEGAVLYKDVLALFGPFAYLVNGLLVKVFGAYIKTFYIAGSLNALLILTGFYFLSREYLNRIVSTVLTVFVLYFCCFAAHLMNYITPYSYGMVYGLSACVWAFVLFVKYLKSGKSLNLYVSMLLAGTAASCKYEFAALVFVMIAMLLIKKTPIMKILKSFSFYLFTPLLCIGVLFLQGVKIHELLNYFVMWLKFASSSDMKEYYTGTFYFSLPYFSLNIKSCAVVLTFFCLLYIFFKGIDFLSTKIGFKYAHWLFYLPLFSICLILFNYFDLLLINFVFCSFAMLLAVLSVIKIRNITNHSAMLFLVIASLAVGAKVFFFVQINQYGRFFLPLILLALIVVLKNCYFHKTEKSQKIFLNVCLFFLVLISFVTFNFNIRTLKTLNHKISSQFGTVYKDEASAKTFNIILDTIYQNSAVGDTVVVLQEGLLINFLSSRKSDKYSYLIPSLLKLYGEENVVKHYQEIMPEMFVILTSPDDKNLICNGWGYQICGFVSKNYRVVKAVESDKLILIFKKI